MKKQKILNCMIKVLVGMLAITIIPIHGHDDSSVNNSLFMSIHYISINPQTGELYASSDDGSSYKDAILYKSIDKSKTWIDCGNRILGNTFSSMAFNNEVIYALAQDKSGITPSNDGLYRSYDCTNWEQLRTFDTVKDILIQSVDQSKIIYVNELDKLYVSKDAHTWETMGFTLLPYVNFDILAVDPSSLGTIYFSIIKGNGYLISESERDNESGIMMEAAYM